MEFLSITNLNTLIIPIVISLSTAFIIQHSNRKAKQRDEHETEVKKLLKQIEDTKEISLTEWQAEVHKNFNEIKDMTKKIADDARDMVPFESCDKRMEKLEERVRKIGG
jgi:uncharacterized membrane-anchored protein YhcB (DUF1043 family)